MAGSMSSPMTVAPSRARVSAIDAPMPREAPVTSATFPASGATGFVVGALVVLPMRTNWPETYADRAERKKRRLM